MAISKAGKAKQKHLYKAIVGNAGPESYPSTVDIKADQLPEIRNWKIGQTYNVVLKLKMRSLSEGGYDGKQPLRATFEIVGSGKSGVDTQDAVDEED